MAGVQSKSQMPRVQAVVLKPESNLENIVLQVQAAKISQERVHER